MELGSVLVFINLAIAAMAAVLMLYIYPFRRWPEVKYLGLIAFSFLVLSFCTVNVYSQQHFEDKVLFSRMRFIGLAFMAPAYVLFLAKVSERWQWILSRYVRIPFLAIPLFTILFTLLPATRDWVVRDFSLFTTSGISAVRFQGGPWLAVHLALAYGSIVIAVILGLRVAMKERGGFRHQISILTAAITTTTVIDMYGVLSGSDIRWQMIPTSTYGMNLFAIVYFVLARGLGDLSVIAKQHVFELLPDPVVIVDRLGRLAGFNGAARTKFGLNDERLACLWDEKSTGIPLQPGEYGLFHDGQRGVFELNVRELTGGSATLRGRLYFFRNLSEQKKVERELERLVSFNSELLSLIGHDLAGSLAGQALLSERVAEKVPPVARNLGLNLKDAAAASRDLVHGLVLWARGLHPDLKSPSRPYEIKTLAMECRQEALPLARAHGVDLCIQTLAAPLVLDGDADVIGTVLRNVISNAIHASRPAQTVNIKLERDGGWLKVCVSDSGVGMKSDHLEALRAQRSVPTKNGYGIGLRLGMKFLERMGGKLEIESLIDAGTQVTLLLPIERPEPILQTVVMRAREETAEVVRD